MEDEDSSLHSGSSREIKTEFPANNLPDGDIDHDFVHGVEDEVLPGFDDNSDHENSNDDSDNDSNLPLLGLPPAPLLVLKPEGDTEEETPWHTAGQLIAFRESASVLADNYLATSKIKLSKGRKSRLLEFGNKEAREVYKQGREDAAKIDVHRKKLTNGDII